MTDLKLAAQKALEAPGVERLREWAAIGPVQLAAVEAFVSALQHQEEREPFTVKHYSESERPIIKGNGFDGLEVGEDRDEAQAFVDWVNRAIGVDKCKYGDPACPCQDGDVCHYEGSNPMAPPDATPPLLQKEEGDGKALQLIEQLDGYLNSPQQVKLHDDLLAVLTCDDDRASAIERAAKMALDYHQGLAVITQSELSKFDIALRQALEAGRASIEGAEK